MKTRLWKNTKGLDHDSSLFHKELDIALEFPPPTNSNLSTNKYPINMKSFGMTCRSFLQFNRLENMPYIIRQPIDHLLLETSFLHLHKQILI